MKRMVSILLSLVLLLGCAYAAAKEDRTVLDFPRSGLTWQIPDAVAKLPGMIVDVTDLDKSFGVFSDELAALGEQKIGVQIKCQKEEIFDLMHRI